MVWETTAADVYENFIAPGAGWVGVCMTALLLAFLSVALAYMMSIIFGLPTLRRWAKAEFSQAAASTILVVLLFTVVQGAELGLGNGFETQGYSYGVYSIQNMTETMAGEIVSPGSGGRVKPWRFAQDHVRNMIDCAQNSFHDMYEQTKWKEQLLFTSIKLKVVIVEIDIPMQLILISFYQDMIYGHYMANIFAWTTMALYFQMAFMQWAETSMFTVFLPLGIIFRILPITRGAGGALIAIAIGLYIVYPMMFLIVAANQPAPSGCQAANVEIEGPPQMCTKDPAGFVKILESQAAAGGSRDLGPMVARSQQLNLHAYFYPLVIVTVVLAFIRAIAPMLGADIAEVGRGLFRMV